MVSLNKFEVKYLDEDGVEKSNFIYVENIDEAIEKISKQYSEVVEINLVKFNFTKKYLSNNKINYGFLCDFCDGLNVLLKSGITFQKALKVLKNQTKKESYKDKINLVEHNILEGNSLSNSLKKVGFPNFMYNLILVGEASGKLEDTLDLIYEYYSEKNQMKDIVKNAMYYPVIVALTMVLAIWICVVNVIPNFAMIFETNNYELPLSTKLLFNTSTYIINNFYIIILAIIIFISTILLFFSSKIGKRIVDYFKLNIVKGIYLSTLNYNFCISMYMLLNSSIDIIKGLTITRDVLNNEIVNIHIEEIINSLQNGMPLSYSLKAYKEFDFTLIALCEIGEETGNLSDAFYKCSKIYKKEIKKYLQGLERKIEITVTVGLGLILGFIMISIILPTYTIINII